MLNSHGLAPIRFPALLLAAALTLAGGAGPLLAAGPAVAPTVLDSPRAGSSQGPGSMASPLIYGSTTTGFPAVGLLSYPEVECTVTLIGCQTILTAAHCFCFDFESDPPRSLYGNLCRQWIEERGVGGMRVYFQHGGLFTLRDVTLHPDWGHEVFADLAIATLDRPVSGIRPAGVLRTGPLPIGSAGVATGFGRTERDIESQAIKRTGGVVTGTCPEGGSDFGGAICWDVPEPAGPDGGNVGLCFNDSGSPLLVGSGADAVVAGVASGGVSDTCLAPSRAFETDVSNRIDWIDQVAGSDLGTGSCGSLPYAFEEGTRVEGFLGELSAETPQEELTFEIPPGTALLRVALNAAGVVEPPGHDFDLFLRRAATPDPEGAFDCSATDELGVKLCEIAEPAAGTWHALVERAPGTPATASAGEFQLVATRFDQGEPGPPPAPDGAWLRSPDLPGFEAKARITPTGGAPVAASLESECIPESLCLSGALAGRPELFVKVIGPRPNGYLWTQISRFTPSRVEVWLRRTATGTTKYYALDPIGAASDDVSGLQDRTAFPQ